MSTCFEASEVVVTFSFYRSTLSGTRSVYLSLCLCEFGILFSLEGSAVSTAVLSMRLNTFRGGILTTRWSLMVVGGRRRGGEARALLDSRRPRARVLCLHKSIHISRHITHDGRRAILAKKIICQAVGSTQVDLHHLTPTAIDDFDAC